jgi:hypothetical protein
MAEAVMVAKHPMPERRWATTWAIEPAGCARRPGDLGGWAPDLRATPHARGS